MPEPLPPFAVVVVNFGSHALIEENFGRWSDVPAMTGRVVVVDNFSGAAEAIAISALCTRLGFELVALAENTGFGSGMNAGVDAALALGADPVILVNPDAVLQVTVAEALVAHVRREPLTMVSPIVVKPDGAVWFEGARVLVEEGRTTTAPGTDSGGDDGWLSGACLAVSAELWKRMGGFDDDYFLYWEDVDISWRAREAGGALGVVRDLRVVHSVGGTQESAGKSPAYVYYNCRNRLVFAAKHLSARQARRWMSTAPGFALRVVQRGGRRAYLRRFFPLTWAAIRGTVDGVDHARRALRKVQSS